MGKHKMVGAYEAKTRLPALLELVQRGQRIVISKHGRPIAELTPVTDDRRRMTANEAAAGLLEFRRGRKLRGLKVKELIESGRE